MGGGVLATLSCGKYFSRYVKDFEMKNRKRFCGRIATGDYDAVIIGHSQFEKIPMSFERQRMVLQEQIRDITNGIADLKANRGDKFLVKQLEKQRNPCLLNWKS